MPGAFSRSVMQSPGMDYFWRSASCRMRCPSSLKRIAKCLQARSILAVGTFDGAVMSDVKEPCAAARSSSFPLTPSSPAWAEIERPAAKAKAKDDTRRIFCIISLLLFRLDRADRGRMECRAEQFLCEASVRKRCVKFAKSGTRLLSHFRSWRLPASGASCVLSRAVMAGGLRQFPITSGISGIFPVRQMSFPGNGRPGV